MAATTVGAILLFVALFILVAAIKTAPERRRRSLHPLQDAYTSSDDDDNPEQPAEDR